MSNENLSDSKLNISALIDGSDSNDASIHERSYDKFGSEGPSTSAKSTSDIDSQALVNKTNLDQLTAISKRLDKLEQSKCQTVSKKTRPKAELLVPNKKVVQKYLKYTLKIILVCHCRIPLLLICKILLSSLHSKT